MAVLRLDSAIRNPSTSSFARRPGSARRTSHMDMSPSGETSRDGLELLGAARDLLTGGDRGAKVVAGATVRAILGPGHLLRSIEVTPLAPSVETLLGRRVGSGFRAALQESLPEQAAERTPLYLLMDDLPVAALISGYADLYLHPADEPGTADQLGAAALLRADVCEGWSAEGTMIRTLDASGCLPLPVGPPAPRPETSDDPLAWHPLPALPPGTMRRRRLVDVVAGDEMTVRAAFRDTHVGADGVERVLHEYELEAGVDPRSSTFTRCEAVAMALPWPECPRAAASATHLAGRRVATVGGFVRSNLRGLGTCTHLNDLLRSLADVVPLARRLGVELGQAAPPGGF